MLQQNVARRWAPSNKSILIKRYLWRLAALYGDEISRLWRLLHEYLHRLAIYSCIYTLCICFGLYTIRDFVIRAPLRLCKMVANNRMAESVWHIQYMFGGDTYWHCMCCVRLDDTQCRRARRHTKPKDRFVTVAGKRARLDINPIRTYGHTRHAVHSVVAPRNYFAAHFVAWYVWHLSARCSQLHMASRARRHSVCNHKSYCDSGLWTLTKTTRHLGGETRQTLAIRPQRAQDIAPTRAGWRIVSSHFPGE